VLGVAEGVDRDPHGLQERPAEGGALACERDDRADWLSGTSNGSPEGISDVPRGARVLERRCQRQVTDRPRAKDDAPDTLLKESSRSTRKASLVA
jgi:hypothetical protein